MYIHSISYIQCVQVKCAKLSWYDCRLRLNHAMHAVTSMGKIIEPKCDVLK